MKSLLARLSKIHEVVIPFANWELFIIRFLFAYLVYHTIPDGMDLKTQPFPNGLAHWVDFTWISSGDLWGWMKLLAIPALISYVLGYFNIVSLGYLFFMMLCFGTLRNSQGAIGHTTQLVSLVILAQFGMSVWLAVKNRGASTPEQRLQRKRLVIHAARVMIAAAYLTTAISKIDNSKGWWLWQTPNLSVQIVKTQANQYYNTLEHYDEFLMEKFPAFIAEHPNVSRVLFAPGLLIELFVFLGLMGRGWSAVVGLLGVMLHRSIEMLMGLEFHLHEVLFWIFYINIPYWLVVAGIFLMKKIVPAPPAKTTK